MTLKQHQNLFQYNPKADATFDFFEPFWDFATEEGEYKLQDVMEILHVEPISMAHVERIRTLTG